MTDLYIWFIEQHPVLQALLAGLFTWGLTASGAALVAVKNCAKKEKVGSRIVVILPSFAERYLSTILFDGLT